MESLPVVTYSEINSWITCRQQHKWRYEDLYRPLDSGSPLRIGGVFAKMMERLYTHRWDLETLIKNYQDYVEYGRREGWYDTMTVEDFETEKAIINAMLTGYHHHIFSKENFQLYIPELEFRLKFPTFILAGKIDGVLKKNGVYYVREMKTKSSWGESDRKKLMNDDQVSTYILALMAMYGNPFSRCLYTVTKKPTTNRQKIKEYHIEDPETKGWLLDQTWPRKSDAQKTEKDLKRNNDEYKAEIVLVDRVETPQEDPERLVQDYLDRPEFYFDEVDVKREKYEIRRFVEKITAIVKEMKDGYRYRNSGIHCGWCSYSEVCVSRDDVAAKTFQYYFTKKFEKHSELQGCDTVDANLEFINEDLKI